MVMLNISQGCFMNISNQAIFNLAYNRPKFFKTKYKVTGEYIL